MQGKFNKSSDLLNKKNKNKFNFVGGVEDLMGTGNQRAALFVGNDE
jgi:hypothetical protein